MADKNRLPRIGSGAGESVARIPTRKPPHATDIRESLHRFPGHSASTARRIFAHRYLYLMLAPGV